MHHRWPRTLTALAVALALATPAVAGLPGAGQHYPNGSSDIMGGVLPPPGFYWINYLAYIGKDKLADKDGDEIGDFKAGVFVEVPRFVYMSPVTILGATWGGQVFFPLYKADAELKVPGATVFDDDSAGLGDIIFSPLVLAWHLSPNLHMGAALDIWAPTGKYDRNNPASQILSKNSWTIEPVFAASYWVPGGIDLSAKFMYDFNTTNDDYAHPVTGATVDLKAGQEFHVDWAVSYALGKEDFRFGASGYYYVQTTEDQLDGTDVSDTKARVASAGPTFKWWPGMGKLSVTAKYLKEFGGRNIAQGQSFWVNSTYAF
ncbi:MAG: SphA family protein [Deferrisomatales bacterium]